MKEANAVSWSQGGQHCHQERQPWRKEDRAREKKQERNRERDAEHVLYLYLRVWTSQSPRRSSKVMVHMVGIKLVLIVIIIMMPIVVAAILSSSYVVLIFATILQGRAFQFIT